MEKKIETYLVATKDMKVEKALTISQIKELLEMKSQECLLMRKVCPSMAKEYLTEACAFSILATNIENYIN